MGRWHIRPDVFAEWKNKPPKKTFKTLSADTGLATGSISTAVSAGGSLETIELIGTKGLCMSNWRDLPIEADRVRLDDLEIPPGTYAVNWKDFVDGAEHIGNQIFQNKSGINTVLTFPGPSLIFAGLVMAKTLRQEEIMHTPLYVGLFVDKNAKSEDFPQFDAIRLPLFTLLIPRAMTETFPSREKRIGVIDDAILTGKTIDALRNYFDRMEPKPACVEFACHVCNYSQTLVKELTPKHKAVTSERNVRMPWGDAFAFENCFVRSEE
jgi:hypothetical protein